ncbi:MAG: fasciclin domain-containing protein [Bacteroidota bacterium]
MRTKNFFAPTVMGLAILFTSFSQAQEADMRKAKLKAESTVETAVVEVGGAAMYPTKNIVENAANSEDHTTLVAAIKAAGLVETLQGEGPFTVFAPTNDAFAKLPEGTVENLLKEENKADLSAVLTYHVIAGKFDAKAVLAAIAEGQGKAELTTVNGATLTATLEGDAVTLVDGNGSKATVTIADALQSNGVIHVIDAVVLPGAKP